MKKNRIVFIFIVLFVLFVSLNILLILPKMLSPNQTYDIATKAIENECSYCLNEPQCCGDVDKDPDHQAPCDWPIRGYCTLSTCDKIEGKKQRCGWYWIWHDANDNSYQLGTNSPNGYGCIIGNSEATMQPRCTAAGPITLGPTNTAPTPTPYTAPTVEPTTAVSTKPSATPMSQPEPTSVLRVPPNEITPIIINNAFPTAEPITGSVQFNLPSIQLPVISLPKAQINLPTINNFARKPLDLFEYIFMQIISLDKRLENTINSNIKRIIK